jgi:exoribonuclease R
VQRIVQSPIRTAAKLAGILVLEGNKTFGRAGRRLLYRCIPDDKRIPIFLVPYTIPASFSKNYLNKFVLFRFDKWTGDGAPPHGILVETLGDVECLHAFYEYQLYRKSLQVSMTELLARAKAVARERAAPAIEELVRQRWTTIEDRTPPHVPTSRIFTIDNLNTVDYDDAFSVSRDANDNTIVSVYITNVFFIIEILELWDALTDRVSTIYLPDRRRPMLPSILTSGYCSLQAGERRFCFVCDFIIHADGTPMTYSFTNAIIQVAKNYSHEDAALLVSPEYRSLHKITIGQNKNVKSPQDVVAFWMIQTNRAAAAVAAAANIGIYKTTYVTPAFDICSFLQPDERHIIQSWNNSSGSYCIVPPPEPLPRGGIITLQITSPIRRIVDLLNQYLFMSLLVTVPPSTAVEKFAAHWMGKLDYINTSMRSIRKIQTDCFLLQKITENPEILKKEYSGFMFDKLVKSDGIITYMVYLHELRLLSRITLCAASADANNYKKKQSTPLRSADSSIHYATAPRIAQFRVYLFKDKDSLKQKIKLGLCAEIE